MGMEGDGKGLSGWGREWRMVCKGCQDRVRNGG